MIGKLVIGIGLAYMSALSAIAQESRSDLFSQQPGRYQIVFNSQVRADTFMIDTATGTVWQMVKFTDLTDGPTVWQIMKRIDNEADLTNLINSRGIKPKESSATPIIPPSKPKGPIRLD
jgi:hypothetical protein